MMTAMYQHIKGAVPLGVKPGTVKGKGHTAKSSNASAVVHDRECFIFANMIL